MTNPIVNQFAQTPVLGQMDLEFQGSVFTAAVSTSQATALVAGQPVYVENSAGGVPKVLALPNAATVAVGVVARNLKDQSFPENSRVEIAADNSVIWMNSNAAITRWAAVENDTSTAGNVGPAGGINPIMGIAFDEATAANQLIRVLVKPPLPLGAVGVTYAKTAILTATLAQINAGLVLIPGVTGKKITVTRFFANVTGNFATGTAVELESTNASPVAVATLAQAGLGTGDQLSDASASNVTLGAGFGAQLGSGDGLQVIHTGSNFTGGTSIQFVINYVQG